MAWSAASGWSTTDERDEAPAHRSRISSQRRIASGTGVGPKTAADARQQRMSNSSRSSPARSACPAARRHASSARAACPCVHAIHARRHQAAALPELVAVPVEGLQRGVRHPLGLVATPRPARPGARAARARPGRAPRAARRPGARCVLGLASAPSASASRPAPKRAPPSSRRSAGGPGRPARAGPRPAPAGGPPPAGPRGPAPRARRPEPLRGRRGERAVALARSPELGAVAAGLREVVADDLVAGVAPRGEPVGEALVQLGAVVLRRALVGGLADEGVGEAERVVPRELRSVGADQPLAHQRDQVAVQVGALLRRDELREGAAVERPPLDGGARQHPALAGLEPVDARGEDGVEARRERLRPALRLGGDELLEEQRVALGALDDALGRAAAPRLRGQPADQLGASSSPDSGSSTSRARSGLGRRPARVRVRQLGAERRRRSSSGAPLEKAGGRTRAGPAGSARPSGRPRRRPRAGGRARRARAAGGWPRPISSRLRRAGLPHAEHVPGDRRRRVVAGEEA